MITFIEKFLEMLFFLFEGMFKVLAGIVETIIESFQSNNRGYNAQFISGYNLLASRNEGFCLTGDKSLNTKDSYQNALVVGGTGTGKSSIVLLPSLYRMKGSFIVHDPSGELFSKSAGYLSKKGYEIKVLNFSKPDVSSGYNPLSRIQSSSDIQKLASMLVQNALGGQGKDPFWNTQATALIAMLITVLKKQAPQFQNLFNVRQLLNNLGGGNTQAVDDLFIKHADEILFAEYKSFIGYDEKVVSGVIATCKAALQIFSDDAIAKVTSFDTLDLTEFRSQPTVLYIQNSIADQRYYSILTSIFFEQFFSYVLSRFPKKGEQDIFFLIDEASSLKLPTLPLAVANVRKHRSGIMLIVQDFNQLVHNYGKHEADAIRANCFAKMYFTGQSLETARDLEQLLGKFEYKDEKEKTVVRQLMTADEIRTMKLSQAIIICGHHQPIKARLRPYYKNFRFASFGSMSPITINPEIPLTHVPVLPMPRKQLPHEKKGE